MSDNVIAPATGDGDALVPLRFIELASGQKVAPSRLDFGTGTAESLVAAGNPLPVGDATLATYIGTLSGLTAPNPGTSVTVLAGSTLILAGNGNRKGLILYFEGDTYVAFGASATSAAMLFLAGSYLNMLSGYVFKGDILGTRVGSVDVTVRRVEF